MASGTSSFWAGSGRRRGVAAPALAAALGALALLAGTAAARQAGDREAPETPRQAAVRAVAAAEAASRQAAGLAGHPDFSEAVSRDGEVEALLERAERVLQAAKSGLARAEQTRSATGFGDCAVLARRAKSTFEEYEERLRETFARIEAERRPPPPPPPPPPPEPEVAPPPPPRRPPSALRRAADLYFSGDYAAAVDLLSEKSFDQRRARAHALLLRSAARYALFLLGGETDYALRGQAAEDVTAGKQADPDLAPDESLFSPRFRDFFAATR